MEANLELFVLQGVAGSGFPLIIRRATRAFDYKTFELPPQFAA
jgi:hypothetical protein